ncbi:hypothetical protein MVEN_02370700 [Mycena venus]|uniref:CxC2-like cysteine cluster KDZ transposase-associated domain-containing protein n=1 Tax=Mycena venus TaxID=2733690 RepID=A0A8H6X2V8_9AGAR|nr:hypothetical protein MVEN_02370700 [Mycena venus]
MSASHKRKIMHPQLVVAATASSVSHTTHDQRRVRTRVGIVGQGAGPSQIGPADQYWADDVATNLARNSADFSYQLGDDSLESQPETALEDGITVVVENAARNTNSDRPLISWHPHKDEYLGENLRREGHGPPKTYARCVGLPVPQSAWGVPMEWRCVDQACLGEIMHCSQCIVASHAQHPMHLVEKWNGIHFVRDRKWLQKQGLRVQLGHPPGIVCPSREAVPHDFVLYDVTRVHEINVDYCTISINSYPLVTCDPRL